MEEVKAKNKLSKKKIILISVLTPVTAFVAAFLILIFVTMGMFSPQYLSRVMTHFDSSVDDYRFFPERVISKGEKTLSYEISYDKALANLKLEYSDGKGNRQSSLKDFVSGSDTMSFIIVKNDVVVYEQYGDGYDRGSVNTSFSMSKSIASLLVGKAIEDGYIKSVKQPISHYIEEFKGTQIGNTTIEELLLMRSDIVYDEDKFLWFGDDSLTYWHPDLRKLALEHRELTSKYDGRFHYNNYHPLLLGIILERATKMSVSAYFESSIWSKIGAEYDASWSLDSSSSGFEKMESGINFRAIDFVKIGSMVLHGGYWNGSQIIGEKWLEASTKCVFPLDAEEYVGSFIEGKNVGYRYMWYSTPSKNQSLTANSALDIFAWGKSDQILYISPSNDTVILRTGRSDGGVKNWQEVLRNLSNALG